MNAGAQPPASTPHGLATGPEEETTSMTGRFDDVRTRWRAAIGPREVQDCPYCPERFSRPGYLDLHKGRRHADLLDAEEQARFDQVRKAEHRVMEEVALHTKCGFFALPLFLLWAATFVLLVQMQANVAWIAMSTPGYALFGGLVYAMAFGYLSGGRTDYYGRG